MYAPLVILMVIVVVVAVLAAGIFLLVWMRRRDAAGMERTTYRPPAAAAPTDLVAEVMALLAARQQIEAVKRVREVTGWGLKESKDYVDAIERDPQNVPPLPTLAPDFIPATGLTPEVNAEIRQLMARNQKIEAVKRVREATGWGLKESKDYVEQHYR